MPNMTMDDTTLIRRIGSGAAAELWLAEDPHLGRLAIKAWSNTHEHGGRNGFLDERSILMRLEHANIVQLLASDEARGWLALEYVDGLDLEAILDLRRAELGAAGGRNERPAAPCVPTEQVAHIAKCVAAALSHAHSKDVLHRDVCPSNVLIGAEGEIRLIDFSISKGGVHQSTTTTGFVRGRLEFLAPELVDEEPTEASDVYSLGMSVWTLLFGRVPHSAPMLNPREAAARLGVDVALTTMACAMTRIDSRMRWPLERVQEHAEKLCADDPAQSLAEWFAPFLEQRAGALDDFVFGP